MKKPETLKYWGVLYFGEGSNGKTLHQAWEVEKIFKYWNWLYKKNPTVHKGILMTNQVLTNKVLSGNEQYYYHFDDLGDTRFCPRPNCWRGKTDTGAPKRHMLHGAVVVLDDISTVLPPDSWQNTPLWLRKQWTQCGHLGLHFLFNCQDPMAYDINARRQTRMAYAFNMVFSNRRPDETAKPVKKIFGFYIRRRIKAKWLWQFGDLEPAQIAEVKEALKAKAQLTKRMPFSGIWKATAHLVTKHKTELYDTLQDVKEYEPKGYVGAKEYDCIDPTHNHTDKNNPDIPYTAFKAANHELV
ncbi:MAG: hypothetical protein ACHQVK_00065 [Candidatus Paceibacterales bacterium]